MRPFTHQRAFTPRLVAAAMLFAAASIATPGLASDPYPRTGGCCSMKSNATAAKSVSACPMSGTAACPKGMSSVSKSASAACPPGMCSAPKPASATSASATDACSAPATISATHKVTRVTRAASASRKHARKARSATRTATGSTTVNAPAGNSGLLVIIDPQTRSVVQATAEQIGQISAGTKVAGAAATASRPSDPEVLTLPGGGQTVRIPDRLMMNAVAHRDAHGKISYDCRQGGGAIAPLPAESPAPSAPSTWEAK